MASSNVSLLHLAIRNPKVGRPNFRGAVMPYKPPIDKIAALFVLHTMNDGELEEIRYWASNDCSDEQFTAWRDEQIYPIDIGDRKYHAAGVGSAMEFITKEFNFDLDPNFQKLLEMINKNNKTGYLKNNKFAVPHILRELYELTDDENFHIEVINRAAHVIEMFVKVEGGKILRDVDGLEDALPNWVEKLAACQYNPLTLGRYMRDLWVSGVDPAEIVERLEFWTKHWDDVQRKLADGRKRIEKISLREWDIAGTKAIFLRTDDHFLAKAAIKSGRWGIRVIVADNGHTTISTNGYDMAPVFAWLDQQEPGRWYYQAKMGAVINGGPQYIGVEPTSIPPTHLMSVMQSKLQPKTKK